MSLVNQTCQNRLATIPLGLTSFPWRRTCTRGASSSHRRSGTFGTILFSWEQLCTLQLSSYVHDMYQVGYGLSDQLLCLEP